MYAYGVYEVIQQQNPASGLMESAFAADHIAEYAASKAIMLSKMHEIAKSHCDQDIPSVDDPGRDSHIAIWASHAGTITVNQNNNHQQIAAPNGCIYWWLKVV